MPSTPASRPRSARSLVVQGRARRVRIAFEERAVDARSPRRRRRRAADRASDRELAATRDTLAAYFEGDDDRLDLPVDFSLVARRSAARCSRPCTRRPPRRGGHLRRARPPGRQPARRRAVGTACATNPIPIVVPCHRVLPASGRLGNYGGGPERKRALLRLEGAPARLARP